MQRDTVTFVETAAESGGARTLVEVELAPGGGTPPHVHRTFAEHFEALDGTLSLQLGRVVRRLAPGERATAPAGVLHRFFNETAAPIRFRVELRPGRVGAEHALRIAYGLACDGRVRRSGVPAELSHIAVLFALGESDLPGGFGIARPLLGWLARRARRRGVERELVARYCT